MKQVYSYFWKTMPIGDLILLAPNSLTLSKSSQIGPSSSNHLKRERNTRRLFFLDGISIWNARWSNVSRVYAGRNKALDNLLLSMFSQRKVIRVSSGTWIKHLHKSVRETTKNHQRRFLCIPAYEELEGPSVKTAKGKLPNFALTLRLVFTYTLHVDGVRSEKRMSAQSCVDWLQWQFSLHLSMYACRDLAPRRVCEGTEKLLQRDYHQDCKRWSPRLLCNLDDHQAGTFECIVSKFPNWLRCELLLLQHDGRWSQMHVVMQLGMRSTTHTVSKDQKLVARREATVCRLMFMRVWALVSELNHNKIQSCVHLRRDLQWWNWHWGGLAQHLCSYVWCQM